MTQPGRKGYDRLELLRSLDAFEYKNDRPPTSREADKRIDGLYTVTAYKRVFGSFRNALVEAGMKTDNRGGKRVLSR